MSNAKKVSIKDFSFSKQNPPPIHICLDTSYLVPIFFKPHTRLSHEEEMKLNSCNGFMEELGKNSVVKVITINVMNEMFNRIIENEVIKHLWEKRIPHYIARDVWRKYYKYISDKGGLNKARLKAHFESFVSWIVKSNILILPETKKYIQCEDILDIISNDKKLLDKTALAKEITEAFKKCDRNRLMRSDIKDITELIIDYNILSDDAMIIFQAQNNDYLPGINHFVSLDKDFCNVKGITVYTYGND